MTTRRLPAELAWEEKVGYFSLLLLITIFLFAILRLYAQCVRHLEVLHVDLLTVRCFEGQRQAIQCDLRDIKLQFFSCGTSVFEVQSRPRRNATRCEQRALSTAIQLAKHCMNSSAHTLLVSLLSSEWLSMCDMLIILPTRILGKLEVEHNLPW